MSITMTLQEIPTPARDPRGDRPTGMDRLQRPYERSVLCIGLRSCDRRNVGVLAANARLQGQGEPTTFVADMNVTYHQEVKEGDPLRFTTRILNCDEKRIHFWHEMYHVEEGYLAATNEVLSVHIDLRPDALGQCRVRLLLGQ